MTATTLKLSDLAGPDADGWSDVAVFMHADGSESEPFVVVKARNKTTLVQFASDRSPFGITNAEPVRRLGRGRLEPAKIVMEGETGAESVPRGDDDRWPGDSSFATTAAR